MFLGKKKEKLTKLKELTNLLKERILNKAFLEDITNKLYYDESKNNIVSIEMDGATLLDSKTGDKYILRILNDCITTDYVCWNGLHHEIKKITFNGDLIIIEYHESTHYVNGSTQEPCSTKKKTRVEFYKHNELRYKREFESQTDFDLTKLLSSTVLRETFINESREAVVKEIVSGDYGSLSQPGVHYFKTSFLDEPPYDTVHCDRNCYVNGFGTITEQEFKDFFNTMNKVDFSPILRK